jgi:hypothetical protein
MSEVAGPIAPWPSGLPLSLLMSLLMVLESLGVLEICGH